ncbi:MAG: efflux RND transporter periplasmic adaptor subunit [Pirellulaceae bacterium]|nr:efflux RND transporter periplasmic adaptor subunit [Pirellulaceae bacterium]
MPTKRTSNHQLAILAALFCVLLDTGGCSQSAIPTKPKEPKDKPKPVVDVAPPLVMSIVEWDEFVGRLEPVETVEVRSRVSGFLAKTSFEEGQIVHRQDVIAEIDQRPFLSEVSRSRANLVEAEAKLAQAQALVSQAQAEAKRAAIHRGLAKKQLDRNSVLIKQKATALQDFEVSEAEFAQSEAEVVVSNSRIESAQSAVVAAQATVNIAQANLELSELNLTYTDIRAPIDGRISHRYVTEGNLVSGGTNDSTLLTTIVSLHPIHCYFDVDEQTFLKYTQLSRDGQGPSNRQVYNPVYLALSNEHDGFPHQGYIDFVDNRMDDRTGTIRGRAILSNENLKLTPGLFARVRLPGSPKYEALLIPDKAIGTDQAEKFVLTVDSNNKVVSKFVTLGPMSHGLRIIRSGLGRDDRVVLSGQQRARKDMEVTVKPAKVSPGKAILPDDYQPVPAEKLFSTKREMAGNVSIPVPTSPPQLKAAAPLDVGASNSSNSASNNSSISESSHATGENAPTRTARTQP